MSVPSRRSPAYLAIADDLRGRIERRELSSGDKLPTERELVDEFGVARMTVRHALDILQMEGLIERRRGRTGGTFIRSTPTVVELTRMEGLMPQLRAHGLDVSSEILDADLLRASTTVAEALALARDPDLPTSLASLIFIVRPPTATPTGKYLGCVHLQKLLREPPSALVGGILDPDLPPLYANDDQETAARYFATYNLVCGPVLDENHHLLGAVAVDDLLDHLLPEDWRLDGVRPERRRGVEKQVNHG